MSNRDDLLAGAKKCLLEKGYSRTTARDIAQASGVSLAAIGYHFGSKDALMNEAMFQAIGEWGDHLEEAFAKAGPDLSVQERFARVFDDVSATFDENQALWMASFELIIEIDHIPGAREMFRKAIPEARTGLANLILGIPEEDMGTGPGDGGRRGPVLPDGRPAHPALRRQRADADRRRSGPRAASAR